MSDLTPCIDNFRKLARTAPHELISWIKKETLRPGTLTHALEYVGDIPRGSEHATEALELLLARINAVNGCVREGALYGAVKLAPGDPKVLDALQKMADSDPFLELRELAAEALEDMSGTVDRWFGGPTADDVKCPGCGERVMYYYTCHTYKGSNGRFVSCMPCSSAIKYYCAEDCGWGWIDGLNPKNPQAVENAKAKPWWFPEEPPRFMGDPYPVKGVKDDDGDDAY